MWRGDIQIVDIKNHAAVAASALANVSSIVCLSPRISVCIKLQLYAFAKLHLPRTTTNLYFSEMNVKLALRNGGFAERSERALSFAKSAQSHRFCACG